MNLPNILTLSRIPLLFAVVGLLHLDSKWHWPATVAFVVFVIAALTDYFDGYYARKMKLVSDFGKLMDAITDKILVLGLFAVLIAFDLLPKWGVLPFWSSSAASFSSQASVSWPRPKASSWPLKTPAKSRL